MKVNHLMAVRTYTSLLQLKYKITNRILLPAKGSIKILGCLVTDVILLEDNYYKQLIYNTNPILLLICAHTCQSD